MFKGISKVLILTLAVTGGISANPSSGEARAVAGIAGHRASSTLADCMHEFYGSGVNVCATEVAWTIPLPVDKAGDYSPRIRVNTPLHGRVRCNAGGIDQDMKSGWGTPEVNNPTDGLSSIWPGTVTVPANGHLLIACTLDPGVSIINVVY